MDVACVVGCVAHHTPHTTPSPPLPAKPPPATRQTCPCRAGRLLAVVLPLNRAVASVVGGLVGGAGNGQWPRCRRKETKTHHPQPPTPANQTHRLHGHIADRRSKGVSLRVGRAGYENKAQPCKSISMQLIPHTHHTTSPPHHHGHQCCRPSNSHADSGASCVQTFDDSQIHANRTTYRT